MSTAEVQAESARESVPVQPAENRVRKHPGRQALPEELPRIERVIGCTGEQCVCDGCGRETTVIGYEESEQLDVEPAKYFVVVTKREKRACKNCEERGALAAPLPPRIIEKSLVSDRVVIDTVVSNMRILSTYPDTAETQVRPGTYYGGLPSSDQCPISFLTGRRSIPALLTVTSLTRPWAQSRTSEIKLTLQKRTRLLGCYWSGQEKKERTL